MFFSSYGIGRKFWEDLINSVAHRMISDKTAVYCTYNEEPIAFRGGRDQLSPSFFSDIKCPEAIEPFNHANNLMKEAEAKIPFTYKKGDLFRTFNLAVNPIY